MYRRTLLIFGLAVLLGSAFLWGAEALFPKSAAGAIVLVSITVLGLWIVRPGWYLRPARLQSYWLVLFGLLLASGAGAALFAFFFKVQLPYDISKLNLIAAMPGILAITWLEELLFRHVLYRWLEKRKIPSKTIITATALAFGWAHLGLIFVRGPIGPAYYLLTSVYMVWIGMVLGEIRRVTASWLMAWLGHFVYNVTVLFFLAVIYSVAR